MQPPDGGGGSRGRGAVQNPTSTKKKTAAGAGSRAGTHDAACPPGADQRNPGMQSPKKEGKKGSTPPDHVSDLAKKLVKDNLTYGNQSEELYDKKITGALEESTAHRT